MKVVIQRSLNSSVVVNNEVIGKIESGMVILTCFKEEDNSEIIDKMIDKIINLRIFDDEEGIMNKSILEVNGSILSISQFTLYADTKKGRRPSYVKALNGDKAVILYNEFNEKLKKYLHVETGKFGADMKVSINNDGPVTIIIESDDLIGKK